MPKDIDGFRDEYDGIEDAGMRNFLRAYARLGVVTYAAQEAASMLEGSPLECTDASIRSRHYKWLKHEGPQYELYRELFKQAKRDADDILEAEARRRAIHGHAEPVYYKGEEVGSVSRPSDTLLIFLLKGAMPEKYADRIKTEHSGSMALSKGPLAGMNLDELAEMLGDDGDDE